ncbi:MAG TPA: sensor domain-containing diguanylate cyclase [Methylomirabilota bacterium]|nr:sensor domain-containing diguanylate cyclase [Methylomirabilota bacterium]
MLARPSVVGKAGFLASWWPAVVVAALLAAAAAWLTVRLRLQAARRRERELEDLVERRTRELLSLSRLTETINSAVRLEEVLEHVWESFRGLVPYNRIGFAEYDTERDSVRAVWARSDASEIRIAEGYEAPLASTSLGRILDTGKPRIIGDLVAYLGRHPSSESTRFVVEEGMRSSLTVPLEAMGTRIGFLFFSSQQANVYSADHVQLLESLSGQLSLAIEKSRLYDRLLETTRELEEANRRLEHAAATDALTGIANRRVFDERLESEWRRCQRNRQPLSVVMIDIDHFKPFNDRHGHTAGDGCLRAVAGSLSESFGRATDLVARYGGEEFAVILSEAPHDQALERAEDLRRRVAALELPEVPAEIRVTLSAGVATVVPDERSTAGDLLRCADSALYTAKREGRNRVLSHPCGG